MITFNHLNKLPTEMFRISGIIKFPEKNTPCEFTLDLYQEGVVIVTMLWTIKRYVELVLGPCTSIRAALAAIEDQYYKG